MAVIGCTAKTSPAPDPDPAAAPSQIIDVSYDDLLNQKQVRRAVDLHVGDTLRVTLGANATTGYRWTPDAQISDTSVLTQTEQSTVAPTNAMPGAPGVEMWTFAAHKTGKATISTSYGQPWPGGEQDAWSFTADVTVTD